MYKRQQYVMLNMNGALLFDSGHAEIRSEAYPLIDKLGKLIEPYQDNIIEVEGHTDNVPIHSAKYEDNDVLSFLRPYQSIQFVVKVFD